MSFRDLDPIEQKMNKRVELMDPKELFDYFEAWYEGLFGVSLPQDRVREMGMFKRFKNVYGPDAGRIMKWFFFKYGGEWLQTAGVNRGKKTRVKVNWWSSRSKHWHDELLDEVRAELAKSRKQSSESSDGFKRAGDLLK